MEGFSPLCILEAIRETLSYYLHKKLYPCGNLIGTVTPIYRLDSRKEACREYGKNSGEKEITRKSNRIARKEIEAKEEANWSNRRNN